MESVLQDLPGALLPWYQAHKRDLPWRHSKDPYHIWLSEIMLQQTRVEAVKGYYARFLEKLPTISALAEAEEDVLLKLWEGLGYYSRVRNLKKAAQQIMLCHDGIFPREYAHVLALPGIGTYTAGAVCSIALGQKTPAVDGNVMRLCSRILADDTPIDQPAFQKKIRQALAAVYPENAGDFTQALMELGATVCGPNRAPDCDHCPCKEFCQGRKLGIAQELPVKSQKKGRKIEKKTVFLLKCQEQYALVKRPEKGLLAGMWQLPELPGTLEAAEAVQALGLPVTQVCRQLDKRHIFTHIEWEMRGFFLEIREKNEDFQWFSDHEVAQFAALPTAYRQFWDAREDF